MADTTRDKPVLDIQTISLGTPIRIDGKTYRVAHPNKLTIEARLAFERQMPRAGDLLKRVDRLKKQERTDLAGLLDRLCRIVLEAPPAVHKSLTDSNRVAILTVFIQLRTATTPRRIGVTRVARQTSRSTGATSSHGLRGSTAARRRTGSAASPSDS